jgi:hypothetical protein
VKGTLQRSPRLRDSIATSTLIWEAAVVVVSSLYTVLYAWPASVAPSRWVWGSHGDALGNAFLFTWVDQAVLSGHSHSIDTQVAIPFGENLIALPHEPAFYWAQLLLASAVGAVASLNLISFLAIPLTAWAMYRLALYLTGSPPAAFFAGIAYGCSTFVLSNTRGEPTLVQVWIFPLAAWALLKVMASPTKRAVIAAAFAVAASAVINFYFTLFAALMCTVLVLAWNAAETIRTKRVTIRPLAASALAGVFGVFLTGVLYAGNLGDLQQRAQATLRSSSALADLAPGFLDFVLPSLWNPWFGGLATTRFLASQVSTGHFALSQMVTPAAVLVLAPLGLFLLIRNIVPSQTEPHTTHRTIDLVALCCVALLGLWLTVPPTAFPHTLRVLSLQLDIHHFFPQFQHFSRATVLLDLGLVPVAALAFAWTARKWSLAAVPLALLLVASVLIEGYEVVPDSVLEVTPPPADAWVAARPGNYAVADYPLIPPGSGGNEYTYLFEQRFHGHPLLNGLLAGTDSESMREEVRDPNRSDVPNHLAELGVRYVLWHPDVLESYKRLSATLAAPYYGWIPHPPGYQLEASFPDGSAVYSITAATNGPFAFYAAGFDPIRPGPDGRPARPMPGSPNPGRIEIYDSGPPATVDLSFDCFGQGGGVAVSVSGKELGSSELTSGRPATIAFRLSVASGITQLEVARTSVPLNSDPTALCTLITSSTASS